MANELPIPPAALGHPSVELIRVWLANQKQHVVLNVGFWENRGLDELAAWGIVIADLVHHLANAHKSEYGRDPEEAIRIICKAFETEMENPTSARIGEFVKENRPE